MTSRAKAYANEPLALDAVKLRQDILEFKNVLCDTSKRYMDTVPGRKQIISDVKCLTVLRDEIIRVAKVRDKKKDKGKSGASKLRVVEVDDKLSKFLDLEKRGLPAGMYSDVLATSYFTDWVARNNRQDGKYVKLYDNDDEFVELFKEDLMRLGSGPTVLEEVYDRGVKRIVKKATSVLDHNGKIINKFPMNKHMTIFAGHYPQDYTTDKNGVTKKSRKVVNKENNPRFYQNIAEEHRMLTQEIKPKRQAYRDAQKKLANLEGKQAMASKVGDHALSGLLNQTRQDLNQKKSEYIAILNQYGVSHQIY